MRDKGLYLRIQLVNKSLPVDIGLLEHSVHLLE